MSSLVVPAVSQRTCEGQRGKGFSLTELAVVLVIVALLIGSLVVPLSAQMDVRNLSDTRKSLAEIREALLGFAMVNGRLPCPAAAMTASGVANAGVEATPILSQGCPVANLGGIVAGVLPWVTLGVDESDAWGRRYTYQVTREFTRPPVSSANAGFSLTSTGDIKIRPSAGSTAKLADVPAVVISHGKNGNGAYTSQGTQLPIGTDPDEQDNQLTVGGTSTSNTEFVKRVPTTTYDDELVWISANVLFSRMIAAGKLP